MTPFLAPLDSLRFLKFHPPFFLKLRKKLAATAKRAIKEAATWIENKYSLQLGGSVENQHPKDPITETEKSTWMSQEVSKWLVNGLQPTYKWGILGLQPTY